MAFSAIQHSLRSVHPSFVSRYGGAINTVLSSMSASSFWIGAFRKAVLMSAAAPSQVFLNRLLDCDSQGGRVAPSGGHLFALLAFSKIPADNADLSSASWLSCDDELARQNRHLWMLLQEVFFLLCCDLLQCFFLDKQRDLIASSQRGKIPDHLLGTDDLGLQDLFFLNFCFLQQLPPWLNLLEHHLSVFHGVIWSLSRCWRLLPSASF